MINSSQIPLHYNTQVEQQKIIHPIKGLEPTKSKTVWSKTNAVHRTATMLVISLLIKWRYLRRYSSSQLQFIYRDVFFRILPIAIKFNFFLITLVSPLRIFLSCGPDTHHGAWCTHCLGLWITQNDAPQFVVLLWASELVAEISSCQHTTLEKNYPSPWRDSNPQIRKPIGLRPTHYTSRHPCRLSDHYNYDVIYWNIQAVNYNSHTAIWFSKQYHMYSNLVLFNLC